MKKPSSNPLQPLPASPELSAEEDSEPIEIHRLSTAALRAAGGGLTIKQKVIDNGLRTEEE